MSSSRKIVCIGAALWDVIGWSDQKLTLGADVPGRVTRTPGGVALNIAISLAGHGFEPILLAAVGNDTAGDELLTAASEHGIVTDHVRRVDGLQTDIYVAVEGRNGLIASVADVRGIDAVGFDLLSPLRDGTLGSLGSPFEGIIAVDGNLPVEMVAELASAAEFSKSDFRVAMASPEKAERIAPLLKHETLTIYANLEEASRLCAKKFASPADAAKRLSGMGASRAIVTDGTGPAAFSDEAGVVSRAPPEVRAARVTGAGDALMAAHIANEMNGVGRIHAFEAALAAAAKHVSGDIE